MARKTRKSRTYRHYECGERTKVTGDDFVYVAIIFHHPDRTYCAGCDDHFPMHQFEWADTGEKLSDYYARHIGEFVGADRFFGSVVLVYLFTGAGLMVGGIAGLLVGRGWGGMAVAGAAAGGALVVGFAGLVVGAVINSRVLHRVFGTDDFTQLD